jgi:hypothetical protein
MYSGEISSACVARDVILHDIPSVRIQGCDLEKHPWCVYIQESDIEKYFFFVPLDLWASSLRQIGYQFLAPAS